MNHLDYAGTPKSSEGFDPKFFGGSHPILNPTLSSTSGCNLCLFQAGEVIFLEGSSADKAYIIESGFVEIFVGTGAESVQLSVLGAGDIFGEMGLIDSAPRSASARAISQCYCVVMMASQIAERITASPPMVQLLVSILLHRNRAYNHFLKTCQPIPNLNHPTPLRFDQETAERQKYKAVLDNIKLESDLRNAVQGQELLLYYQPLLNLSQGNLVGFEALLRWQSPSRGMVSPKTFIELAEETSLIVPIGFWILERAFADLKIFQDRLARSCEQTPALFVSVNISVRQFQEPVFFSRLLDLTQKYGISPKQIKLEVTERIFLDEIEAIEAISQCREAGFEVSLDDFGTGYSSLNYLERCEIDSLKIDQSFTRKLCTSERAKILVGSIIDISKKLGLPTVAEGIETPEQMVALRELGCEIGQGYLFGKPVTFANAVLLLKHRGYEKDRACCHPGDLDHQNV